MIAVLYDPGSGTVLSTIQASRATIEKQGRPFVEVAERRDDYDVTHRVVDGKLELIS